MISRIAKNVFQSLFFLGMFFVSVAFRNDDITKVLIDGKEIQPEGTITLQRDDTIYLECFGLQPNSKVEMSVKKLGIKWAEDTYDVNESGSVKEILFVPEEKITVNCTVNYIDEEGNFKLAQFKLKIV